jgi:hypothetical protein
VSASNLQAKLAAALSKAAVWVSVRLTAALAVGLLLIPVLDWVPPFLAPHSTAAPVAIVRTVPVPYLDAKPPQAPPAPPPSTSKDTTATILHVVRRAKGQPKDQKESQKDTQPKDRREGESGALGKAGVDASEAKPSADARTAATDPKAAPKADPKPAPKADLKADPKIDPKATPPADAKTPATKAVPPEPDTWTDTEVIAALRDCLRKLAPLGAEVEIAQPVKQERCGAPAPVVLRRLGTGAGKVELQPPPTINCAMVASLHAWVEKILQPAAQELLGSPIVRIRQLSGYACRNRIGTVQHADRLSEHALANAIDIAGFVTADGRTVDVLDKWGPTLRDLRAAQEKAWEAVQAAKAAVKQAESEAAQAAGLIAKAPKGPKREQATTAAAKKKEEVQRKREDAQAKEADWRKALALTAEMQRLGRGADAKEGRRKSPRLQRGAEKKVADAKALTPIPPRTEEKASAEALFLRRLHKGACGPFGTVLGPEANEAHRNHFHFDLAARKRSAFCE